MAVPLSPPGLTKLHEAISCPKVDLGLVEELIKLAPSSLHSVHPNFKLTPLQSATRRGHVQLIRLLIRCGADLEARTESGETPFLIACLGGSLYAVNTIVDGGADVRAVTSVGQNAMHCAAQMGAVHVMHYLSVTQGLGFNCTDIEGNTPLHLALKYRNLETVKYLIKHNKCGIQAANNHGTTPMHVAASLGSFVMCWLLASNSTDDLLTAKDNNGYTPFHRACMGNNPWHSALAKKLKHWSHSSLHFYARLYYWLYFFLPGLSLLLAMVAFCQLQQPIGLLVAVVCVLGGFFYPMSYHRTTHVSALPNPALYGALISGLIHTAVCYFIVVRPRLWPGNIIWLAICISNGVYGIYLLLKLKTMDAGFDRVGKIDSHGKPMTILDVACQGDKELNGSVTYSFCPSCEIVMPEKTKHCKLCEGCVNGFDHHCMWVDNCVGYKNHRIFVLFALFLWTENYLFVQEAYSCLALVYETYSPLLLMKEAFFADQWILFLMVCNILTGLFVLLNFLEQIRHVSTLETVYFDMAGKPAYGKKRDKLILSTGERIRLLYLFFMNYQKWLHESYRDTLDSPYGSGTSA